MFRSGLFVSFFCVATTPVLAASEPHFVVLPGIEGPGLPSRGVVSGLHHANPNCTTEVYDWTTGHAYRALYHLRNYNRNQNVAAELANHIVELRSQQPDRPLVLIGHSGGAAVIVMALDLLPEGTQVNQVVLLSPALSPNYPLTTALNRSINGIDVFHSRVDFLVQGAGTTMVGTIDRSHVPGAGMVGFHTPANLDDGARFLYSAKLHQHGYNPSMALSGHFGGHYTYNMPDFVKSNVYPVVIR